MKRATFMLAVVMSSAIGNASPSAPGIIVSGSGCHSVSLYSEPTLQNVLEVLHEKQVVSVLDDHSFGKQYLVETAGHYGFVEAGCVQITANSTQQAPQPTPAQTPPPASLAAGDNACQNNISFAVVEGGQVIPGVPTFAAKWITNKKHLAKHPGICVSQTPSPRARNVLIVFSHSASSFLGLYPTVRTNTTTSPVYGSGTVTDNYGEMWNYTYSGSVTTTTQTTENVPYTDTSRTLYAYAYSQQGSIISSRWATVTTRQGGDPYNSLGYNLGSAVSVRPEPQ